MFDNRLHVGPAVALADTGLEGVPPTLHIGALRPQLVELVKHHRRQRPANLLLVEQYDRREPLIKRKF